MLDQPANQEDIVAEEKPETNEGPARVHYVRRVQLDLSAEMAADLDRLVKDSDAKSLAEVVHRSLDIFEHLLHARERGERILLQREDGTTAERLVIF